MLENTLQLNPKITKKSNKNYFLDQIHLYTIDNKTLLSLLANCITLPLEEERYCAVSDVCYMSSIRIYTMTHKGPCQLYNRTKCFPKRIVEQYCV